MNPPGTEHLSDLTVVVDGNPVHVSIIASTEPIGQYSFPCKLYFSPKVAAKAYELAMTARLQGRSLKNPGLEFLRRLLVVKQAREVLEVLGKHGGNTGCFVNVVEKRDDGSDSKGFQEKGGRASEGSRLLMGYEDAVNYYRSRLCISGEGGERVGDLGELEELVIAYQSLTIEDKWPKC